MPLNSARMNDYRLVLGDKELKPIMVGGMGVNISTRELALEAARLGGVGHISDALTADVSDRLFGTHFVKDKAKRCAPFSGLAPKTDMEFVPEEIERATHLCVEDVMNRKTGDGLVFINCMEKLTMNDSFKTLPHRLNAALDAGIDGISLSAGLHISSFAMMAENKRFRHAKLGIVVSSVRALNIFLKKSSRTGRLPDFVVVEGPLAGGHLGFGFDWEAYSLQKITAEVIAFLKENHLEIPVIAGGGVFTGTDGVELMQLGADGYLCKDTLDAELFKGLRSVVSGHRYLSEREARSLLDGVLDGAGQHPALSAREQEVLVALVHGHSLSAIGDTLHLSVKTVSTYKTRLMQKLNCKTKAELVDYALKHHLM